MTETGKFRTDEEKIELAFRIIGIIDYDIEKELRNLYEDEEEIPNIVAELIVYLESEVGDISLK